MRFNMKYADEKRLHSTDHRGRYEWPLDHRHGCFFKEVWFKMKFNHEADGEIKRINQNKALTVEVFHGHYLNSSKLTADIIVCCNHYAEKIKNYSN